MTQPTATLTEISIHALREEGDAFVDYMTSISHYFYPRPPRGGRRFEADFFEVGNLFLSTPSARRATCGNAASAYAVHISIHALREEGDLRGRRRNGASG